jgi:4-amino-4-deoxy-L-arabinose transferase-like glycosyltransferase
MRQPAYLVALALIGAVALGLRLWGIGFGLPQLYHPDEPAYVLQALAVGRGLPDGLTFANPPLFKYLLLAEYAATYLVERAPGQAQSAAAFVEQFRADPSRLYLIARVTSAVLGAFTALVTGLLGTIVGGRRVGLLAGSLAAVTYLLVRDAHFGTDDMLVTLLVTLGLAACVRIITGGRRRDYVVAGALVGLAFAAKYDGLALLVPLLLAHAARRCRRLVNLGVAVIAAALAAIAAFPSLLTEPQRVIGDVYTHLYLEAANGYDGLDPSGGYIFYARTLVIALGWPLLVATVDGAVLSAARRHWPSVVVLSLPVAMLAVLGSQQLYFARFALPVLPALIVQASLAVDALLARQAVIGVVALTIAAAVTLTDAIRFDGLITQTDTRTLAVQWLPTAALYAADAPPLGPPLPQQRNLAADGAALYDTSLDAYRGRGVEYLIVSSFTADARAVDPAREAKRLAFNAALANEQLVATFSPGDVTFVYDQIYGPYTDLERLERPGPKIGVYRLTP